MVGMFAAKLFKLNRPICSFLFCQTQTWSPSSSTESRSCSTLTWCACRSTTGSKVNVTNCYADNEKGTIERAGRSSRATREAASQGHGSRHSTLCPNLPAQAGHHRELHGARGRTRAQGHGAGGAGGGVGEVRGVNGRSGWPPWPSS